jgi:hypothetical protein
LGLVPLLGNPRFPCPLTNTMRRLQLPYSKLFVGPDPQVTPVKLNAGQNGPERFLKASQRGDRYLLPNPAVEHQNNVPE